MCVCARACVRVCEQCGAVVMVPDNSLFSEATDCEGRKICVLLTVLW